MSRIIVIGVGQSLRGDDGAGPAAVRQWQERFMATASRPEVRCEACEVPGLALLDLFDDADAVIVVDAVQSSAKPGTIHRLRAEDLETFAADSKLAHGWGMAETLSLYAQLADTQVDIRIIGIEACEMKLGAGLSEEVRSALPGVSTLIEETVCSLLK